MALAELKNDQPKVDVLEPGKPRIRDIDEEKVDGIPISLLFNVEHCSAFDGKTRTGDFRVRRLTLGMYSRMRVVEAQLNGGVDPGAEVSVLNIWLAYCRVAIVSAPEWWDPENLYDAALLRAVHDHGRQWESSFRGKGVV